MRDMQRALAERTACQCGDKARVPTDKPLWAPAPDTPRGALKGNATIASVTVAREPRLTISRYALQDENRRRGTSHCHLPRDVQRRRGRDVEQTHRTRDKPLSWTRRRTNLCRGIPRIYAGGAGQILAMLTDSSYSHSWAW